MKNYIYEITTPETTTIGNCGEPIPFNDNFDALMYAIGKACCEIADEQHRIMMVCDISIGGKNGKLYGSATIIAASYGLEYKCEVEVREY